MSTRIYIAFTPAQSTRLGKMLYEGKKIEDLIAVHPHLREAIIEHEDGLLERYKNLFVSSRNGFCSFDVINSKKESKSEQEISDIIDVSGAIGKHCNFPIFELVNGEKEYMLPKDDPKAVVKRIEQDGKIIDVIKSRI